MPEPETTSPAEPVPGLRDQIAGVFRAVDGELPAWTKRDAGPEAHVDAVMAVVQPYLDRLAADQERYEEETVGRFNQQATNDRRRAETAEAMTAEVTEALRRANRELDAAATKWDLDLDKRTADLTQRAEEAEAALTRVRATTGRDLPCVKFEFRDEPSDEERGWVNAMAAIRAALTPPVPADQPEGGEQ